MHLDVLLIGRIVCLLLNILCPSGNYNIHGPVLWKVDNDINLIA